MVDSDQLEAWLVTGSQEMYGPEVVKDVGRHAQEIACSMSDAGLPVRLVAQPVATTSEAIRKVCLAANDNPHCVGVVMWMHTFSPAKMWIAGLQALQQPMAHLHTQFNRDLPWGTIDMDFMNLNQSAHGDREFGFIAARLRRPRIVIAGHWRDPAVIDRLGVWARVAQGWHELRRLKVARFGDNMRQVAVTEGDKVEAQIRLGLAVNTFGVADLAAAVDQVTDREVDELVRVYLDRYEVAAALRPGAERHGSLRYAARLELALRGHLTAGGFGAFTDTFEDLGALRQLPGIAVQRLMADGYGFGAEGDWKTAALVRLLKTMAAGLPGGTSFMEDYTYHLAAGQEAVLGAHMLEICPSIAAGTPSCEIHPLSIGRRDDPVRLVFTAAPGPAVVVGLVDLGDRLRLVANAIEVVEPPQGLPRLPVARAVWRPEPNLRTSAEAWILAGGPHHTAFSQALTLDHLADFAEIAELDFVRIDRDTRVSSVRQELRWNDAAFRLAARS